MTTTARQAFRQTYGIVRSWTSRAAAKGEVDWDYVEAARSAKDKNLDPLVAPCRAGAVVRAVGASGNELSAAFGIRTAAQHLANERARHSLV